MKKSIPFNISIEDADNPNARISGVMQAMNKTPILRAQYRKTLYALYPEMAKIDFGHLENIDPSDGDAVMAVARIPSLENVASVAAKMRHIEGLPLQWPKPQDAPNVQAFYEFLLEQEDAFDALIEIHEQLERPNGVEGANPASLTEAERNDPLSISAAMNGAKKSVNISTN